MERPVWRRRKAKDGGSREDFIGHGGKANTEARRASNPARKTASREQDLPSRPPHRRRGRAARSCQRLRAKDPELIERLMTVGGPPPLRRREAGFAGMAAI